MGDGSLESLKKKSPIFWTSVLMPGERNGTMNAPQKERWPSLHWVWNQVLPQGRHEALVSLGRADKWTSSFLIPVLLTYDQGAKLLNCLKTIQLVIHRNKTKNRGKF